MKVRILGRVSFWIVLVTEGGNLDGNIRMDLVMRGVKMSDGMELCGSGIVWCGGGRFKDGCGLKKYKGELGRYNLKVD